LNNKVNFLRVWLDEFAGGGFVNGFDGVHTLVGSNHNLVKSFAVFGVGCRADADADSGKAFAVNRKFKT
jgi:hypothetical protein